MATLGKQIREAREKKGVSVEALAKRMKVSEQRIDDIENGVSEPDMYELACIVALLNVKFKTSEFNCF